MPEPTTPDIEISNTVEPVLQQKGGDWINDLPYRNIRAGGQSIFSFATVLLENKGKWVGQWKQDGNEGVLKLDPVPTPSTVKFSDNEFYDGNLAAVVNGKIIPRDDDEYHTFTSIIENSSGRYYMRAIIPKEGDVPLVSKDGKPLIFRGINRKDMINFLKNGVLSNYQLESDGPTIFAPTDNYFSSNTSAFQYAVEAQFYGVPTFEEPAYVVVMEKPDENVRDIPEAHEVVVQRPVKLEEIKTVYEIKPFKIKSGNIGLWQDDTQQTMRMSDAKDVALDSAPQVECVYKKIDVDSLK